MQLHARPCSLGWDAGPNVCCINYIIIFRYGHNLQALIAVHMMYILQVTHHFQYPPGTETVYSYFESRDGKFPDITLFWTSTSSRYVHVTHVLNFNNMHCNLQLAEMECDHLIDCDTEECFLHIHTCTRCF